MLEIQVQERITPSYSLKCILEVRFNHEKNQDSDPDLDTKKGPRLRTGSILQDLCIMQDHFRTTIKFITWKKYTSYCNFIKKFFIKGVAIATSENYPVPGGN